MPLGVTLADLRYDLRAEIYSSLLPAHGLSSVDMQNIILERTQRELWNMYEWPHLEYRIDQTVPNGVNIIDYPDTMPFENLLSIWWNYNPTGNQAWVKMRYGFPDSINPVLKSFPPTRWRNVVTVTGGLTQIDGQCQLWPMPTQTAYIRFKGQAPLNPLKVDTDKCMIDSTAIILTAASELLGSQKAEVATLKGQKAQAYIRRLLGRLGANKRSVCAMGQGMSGDFTPAGTPYIDYIPGP